MQGFIQAELAWEFEEGRLYFLLGTLKIALQR